MGVKQGIPQNYFAVEIEGIQCAKFRSCEGLEAETYVYEIEEGGWNSNTHKFLGRNRYPNILLENGITDDTSLFDWHHDIVTSDSEIERKSIDIVMYDIKNQEVRRWSLFRAIPCRWVGPTMSAEAQGLAVECIEIAHEGIEGS